MTPFKPWGTPPSDPNNAACILPFEPNWSTPVQETLAWKMAPMLSQAGNEQRRSLRREPRQSIEFTTLVRPDEMPLLQSILWGWAGGTFAVPLWYGKSTLASQGTAGASAVLLADSPETLFQAGGWALLWSGTRSVEAVPVASITGNTLTLGAALAATWAEGTTIAPLQFMQLQDSQSYTPVTDGVAQVAWVFEQVPGHAPSLEQWAASTWSETFPTGASAAEPRNHFFAFPHNWAGSPQVTVVTQANVFDPGLSVISRRRSVDRPTPSWALDTVLDSRASTASLRKFLAAHAGSAVGFWAASPVSDITLTADISSATLAVVDNGQATMPSVLRTGLVVTHEDGSSTRELVELLGAASITLAREPAGAALAGVTRAGWATHARLAVDAITIEHLTDRVATCRLPVVAVATPALFGATGPQPQLLLHFDGDLLDAVNNVTFDGSTGFSTSAVSGFGQMATASGAAQIHGTSVSSLAIGTQAFTIEGRSVFSGAQTGGTVLAKNYWAAPPGGTLFKDDFSVVVTPTQISMGWTGQLGDFNASISTTGGVPFTWAISDDGTAMRFYLNGTLIETRTSVAAASPPPPVTSGSGLTLLAKLQGFAGEAPNWTSGYNGALDELVMWVGVARYTGSSYTVRATPYAYTA